ncbi:Dna Repair Protein Rad51-like 1 [Manis pentadactyla]|nr:Dna Repair Protein Rad51-like 1 [Manis pentadactyla]
MRWAGAASGQRLEKVHIPALLRISSVSCEVPGDRGGSEGEDIPSITVKPLGEMFRPSDSLHQPQAGPWPYVSE